MHRRPGTYGLILRSSRQQRIQIGRLGDLSARKGYYIYVGSAFGPGGLAGRVQHHCRVSVSPCWHIDYLRPAVEMAEVWYSDDPQRREHQWGRILKGIRGAVVPMVGFGASDCGCDSHLFYFTASPALNVFRRRVREAIPGHHQVHSVRRHPLANLAGNQVPRSNCSF